MLYSARIKQHVTRDEMLGENLKKAYALIYSNYCTTGMQQSLQELSNFQSEIQDDPIKLLAAIETLAHNPVKARYPFVSLTSSLARMMNIRQQENESLIDWGKRFKQERDVFKNHVGDDILHNFVENTEDYQNAADANEKQALKDGAWDQWMGYLFVKNANPKRYGSLCRGWASQYSMNTDQYPRSYQAAFEILRTHVPDTKPSKDKKTDPRPSPGGNNDNDGNQTPATGTESSFAQSGDRSSEPVICYICGKEGHHQS